MTTTTLSPKTFAQLFTAAGGVGGTLFNAAGRLVPQACPAFEADPNSGSPLGLRTRGSSSTNMAFPSGTGPAGEDSYYNGTIANPLIMGQQSLRMVAKGTGSPPTVRGSHAGDGNSLCASAIIETDPASVAGVGTLISIYKTAAPAAHLAQTSFVHASGAIATSGAGATGGAIKLKNVGPNGGAVWLVWTSVVVPSGTSGSLYLYPVVGGTTANQSCFVHHFQMERASRPSSPIITTTGAITRAADTVIVPNINAQPWFNATEFTVLVDFTIASLPPPAGAGIVSITAGAGANRTALYIAGTGSLGVQRVKSGSTTMSATTPAIPAGVRHRAVFSMKKDRLVLAYNGTLAGVATSGDVADSTGADMAIGNLLGAATYTFDGWIHDVRYWPKAANATEILAMTPTTEVIAG